MFTPSFKHVLAILLTVSVEDNVFFVSVDLPPSDQAVHFALWKNLMLNNEFAIIVEVELIISQMAVIFCIGANICFEFLFVCI